MKFLLNDSCSKCGYYRKNNNTCLSKKCSTGKTGYVNLIDRIFCKPYIEKKGDSYGS
jgi:hypothetical protein